MTEVERLRAAITGFDKENNLLRAEIKRLRTVLVEIEKGEGRYNPDNFAHARNTIADMKQLACDGLNCKTRWRIK